jgi:hypothetical protein
VKSGEVVAELWDDGHVVSVQDHGKVQTVWYDNGDVGLRHVCTRPRDELTLVVAPRLMLGSGHTITPAPVTVSPSCGCFDCGLHGFLTNGEWRDC